uniref:Endonuclease/exonuclease/phosphatase domain-containing protein n=1 Tax=Chromera velia CCMP2878 TaxID=1169474 RepID=A0A0G4F2T9_9ALVE|eukprot:Cvel_14776.t1-p1 / transcript=Cvel_14776.t1 / gene=Cvel_14776 / organism=Chromera_velia_CCMP2878 / gene_product=hypothetical protein / transcript_product=hypothetical protein / location=Cvel_scaffold1064:17536-20695(+) / protein_length=329 / sequence_SO=supercontig / SO=protein_coding / is_pseudo=false
MKPNKEATRHNPCWEARKHLLLSALSNARLDVFCLQELSVGDAPFFKEALSRCGYVMEFYSATEEDGPHRLGVAVAFCAARLQTCAPRRTGFFEAQDEDGETRRRGFLSLDLRDIGSGLVTRVASVHLYGGSSRGNPLALAQMKKFRADIEDGAETARVFQVVVAGDMNSDVDEEHDLGFPGPCGFMLSIPGGGNGGSGASAFLYGSVWKESAPPEGQGRKIPTTNKPGGRHLDWVFVGRRHGAGAGPLPVLRALPLRGQDRTVSDHRLTALVIEEAETFGNQGPEKMKTKSRGHLEVLDRIVKFLHGQNYAELTSTWKECEECEGIKE